MSAALRKATKIIRDASRETLWTGGGKIINPEIFTEAARKILALGPVANDKQRRVDR
ncbi:MULTISPECIES: hypothetical protein [Bosea]|jgi:hypothetical protein|uniref:hypothetical protein n=1 Tax=Bosea TaxID=85413 RepID=UPI0021504EA4|nr:MULTISPECIES: hypothetical protein [Bosea]MCR4524583.1 hypothetical protein [Bosea sp. 47.2.35]MDR6830122.1 hypothetical protein [Bosea robiniae]MDR6896917.1 hypothetical protein [Bosea sp. BE109]MDR7140402.1 hypothetical protein [Bosea sp. BE168]MDR7177011.1 hypothetical protein [Bosea sp. BE271]